MEHVISVQESAGFKSIQELISIAQDCRKTKDLHKIHWTYTSICEIGLERHHVLGNYLVPMFVGSKSMVHAKQTFQRLIYRNEHSWTSLIQGFVEDGKTELALNILNDMRTDSFHPSIYTFAALLKGCAKIKDLATGQRLHWEIAIHGLDNEVVIGNSLVSLYAKCNALDDARQVFDALPARNIVTWNALIGGYTERGFCEEVLMCIGQMQAEGLPMDVFTYSSIIKSCGNLGDIIMGRKSYSMLVKQGFEREIVIGNALVDMYAKCGSLEEAQIIFDGLCQQDIVTWTSLIVGYAEQGQCLEAHKFFIKMQLEGLSLDVVLWSALILAYAEQEKSDKAFLLFGQMQEQGLLPNRVTFLNVLKACSKTGGLKYGNRVHAQIHNLGWSEVTIANTLVSMYGKCGSLVGAQEVFDMEPVRNVVRWNAFITGYAHQGDYIGVFELFEKMREEKIQPDEVTFVSVLSVCCHAGNVEMGLRCFEMMGNEFGILPTANHYNCIIDLLGRAGQLNEAVLLLKRSSHVDIVGWNILLCACRKWGDVQAGEAAFEVIMRLKEDHSSAFVVMSNIYADACMWEDAKRIEELGHFSVSKESSK